MKHNWIEETVRIGDLQNLLKTNMIEVDSPDGWVPVSKFVDKGLYQEYILSIEGNPVVRCNKNHLFETTDGWQLADDLLNKTSYFITKDSIRIGTVEKTNNLIPIVDIRVEHENHRYYTNRVSSHNTGVGKSLTMCHFAAAAIMQKFNVLYITMEMSEKKIAERIDANLLDVNISDMETLDKSIFETRIKRLLDKTIGKLIIKEYPTSSAHVGHFRALLEELKVKKNFKPDMIFIDYLNICSSQRLRFGAGVNSYTYVKSIAEELRGLAVEYDVPLISATQTNRCLSLDTLVLTIDRGMIPLKDIQLNDKILSNDEYVTVNHIFPIEKQKVYEITTKSGKKIKCSAKHLFPTSNGVKSIESGLTVNDRLFVKLSEITFDLDEIVSIVELDEEETIDITVSGNNLFYANDILTHNSGTNSTDLDLTDTSESNALPATCDLFLALMSSEELDSMGQMLVKQLKNRYNDLNNHKRFTIGVDKSKMRLFDVESSAQYNISGNNPAASNPNDFTSFKQSPMLPAKTKQVSTSDFVF